MVLNNSSIIYAEFIMDNLDNKLSNIFKDEYSVSLTLLSGENELPSIIIK